MFCAQSIWVVHHRNRDATNHNIKRDKNTLLEVMIVYCVKVFVESIKKGMIDIRKSLAKV